MVSMTRRSVLTLAGGAVVTSVFGNFASAEQPRYGGTLNIGFTSDAETFNPIFSVEFSERQVLYLVYDTLLRMGTDFSIHPGLAQRWDVKQGGKRVVFHLRKGVKFHDGTDFDASAVKWNFDERLSLKVKSPQYKILSPVIKSVDVIDKHTVALNLFAPFSPLFGYLTERSGFMASPTAAKKYGQNFGSHPVGTGPFLFKSWERGSSVVVVKNPHYWESGLPYLDKIVFSDIGGAVIGTQRLLTGELDFVGNLSPQDIREVQSSHQVKLQKTKVGRWFSLQWHWNQPPFNNSDLRKAIAYALDRDQLNQVTQNGAGTIANSPTPPGLWWHDPHIVGYKHDPAKAKQYLRKAGHPNGLGLKLWTPSKTIYRQINSLVQQQLAAVGIKANLAPVAHSEWYARVVKGSIDFTPMDWTQRPDPDGLLYILFDSNGYANTTGYSNPKVDKWLHEGRRIFDKKKRKELYFKVQQQISDDLPYVPLFFAVEYAAMSKKVRGFMWTPDQIPRFYNVWKSA